MQLKALLATALVALSVNASFAQTTNPVQAPGSRPRDVVTLDPAKVPEGKDDLKPKGGENPSNATAPSNTSAPDQTRTAINLAAQIETARQQIKKLEKFKSTCQVDVVAAVKAGQANRNTQVESTKTALHTRAGELRADLREGRIELSMAEDEAEWWSAVYGLRQTIDAAVTTVASARTEKCADESALSTLSDSLTTASADLQRALTSGNVDDLFARNPTKTSLLNAFQLFASDQGGKQLTADPINYYFTNKWRLYVRSTLTFDPPEEDNDGGEDGGEDDAAAAEPTLEDLSEGVRLALQDPYAGVLNLSTGYLAKVPFKFLVGAANDAQHGLFLDSRVGLRFVGLPEDKMTLTTEDQKKGETKATPFYQVSTALRLILPIFREDKGSDKPGGVEIALTGAWSRVAYRSASTLFEETEGQAALLRPSMGTLHLAMAFQLPGWASLNLSSTLWSSEKFEKRYLIGLTFAENSAGDK